MAEDVSQEGVEVDEVAWIGRVAQNDDHQFVGGEDKDVLPVVAIAIVHVLGHVGKLAATVQPEEGAIAVAAGGSWTARIIYPSFGQYALGTDAAVVEVQLSETCEILCRGIEVGGA